MGYSLSLSTSAPALALVCAVFATSPLPARGDFCGESDSLELGTHKLPIDGVVPVIWHCGDVGCDDSFPEISVIDKVTGETVPGAIVRLGANDSPEIKWGLWKPTDTLVAGHFYSFSLYVLLETLQAVAPIAFDPTTLAFEPTSHLDTQWEGELTCCGYYEVDSCHTGAARCFAGQQRRKAIMTVTVPDDVFEAHQWLYTVHWKADGLTVKVGTPQPVSQQTHVFEEDPREFCYEVHATSVADGSEVLASEGCVANPYTNLGVHDTDDDGYAQSLGLCEKPPAGFEDVWCGYNDSKEYCAEHDSESSTHSDSSSAGSCSVGAHRSACVPWWAAAMLLITLRGSLRSSWRRRPHRRSRRP